MDNKEVLLNGKKVSYNLVLNTIKNLKCLLEQRPVIFYKLVQRCSSNSLEKSGCHKYSCPKGGLIVSQCGLNFHDFNVCRIVTTCVKKDGIDYQIEDPFEQEDTEDSEEEDVEEMWV